MGTAAQATHAELAALARQAAALPVRTLDGVWVKARIAAEYGVCDPTGASGYDYPGDDVVRSLYRDAPRSSSTPRTTILR